MTQDRFDNLIFLVVLLKKQMYYKKLKDYTDKTITCSPLTAIIKKNIINICKSLIPSQPVDSDKYS